MSDILPKELKIKLQEVRRRNCDLLEKIREIQQQIQQASPNPGETSRLGDKLGGLQGSLPEPASASASQMGRAPSHPSSGDGNPLRILRTDSHVGQEAAGTPSSSNRANEGSTSSEVGLRRADVGFIPAAILRKLMGEVMIQSHWRSFDTRDGDHPYGNVKFWNFQASDLEVVKLITGICKNFGADQLFEFVESATKKSAYMFLGDCCTSFKHDLEDFIDRAHLRGTEAREAEKARAMEDLLRRSGPEGGGEKGRPRGEWKEEREEIGKALGGHLTQQEGEYLRSGGKKGRNPNRIRRWVGRK